MIGMKTAAVAVFDDLCQEPDDGSDQKDENVYWNARNTGHDLSGCVEPALLKPVRQ